MLVDPDLNFSTPQLRKLLDVWRAKRDGRTLPARADMTLRDLTFVLPNIAFLGIVREGGRMRFKVRLAGSEIDAYTGPMTGRFIDEAVPAKFSEKWSMPWIQAIESRRVLRTVGRVEYRDRAYYISETLCAPLATDGEHPDILMVAVYYHVADGNVASDTTVAQCLTRDLAAVS